MRHFGATTDHVHERLQLGKTNAGAQRGEQKRSARQTPRNVKLHPASTWSPQRWGSTSSIPECSTDTRVRGQPLAADATTTRCLIQLFFFSALHNSRESERPFDTPFVVDDGENLPDPSTTSLRYCRPLNMSVIRLFNRQYPLTKLPQTPHRAIRRLL